MDVRSHNRAAWNKNVDEGNRWTRTVSTETVAEARLGRFEILLTPGNPVPMAWFPELSGTPTLCLASAGGQQAPVLAAAGAHVTVFDNSPKQLEQDCLVAKRDGLQVDVVEGDMADLSCFPDNTFGLIFHPCSNCFVPDVVPVWQECHRVLRPGGALLAGFVNPVRYLFDDERKENGNLEVRYCLPYSDLEYQDDAHVRRIIESGQPMEFGHTLENQIGAQLNAGLCLTGMYEDRYAETDCDPISRFMATFIATKAVKR
ncbi:MAG: class I SAM-dependent methyltransferase [Fuerstiella sp.]|nr:class I SAM-dependent methyltransferase [Fuerstiella sp.]